MLQLIPYQFLLKQIRSRRPYNDIQRRRSCALTACCNRSGSLLNHQPANLKNEVVKPTAAVYATARSIAEPTEQERGDEKTSIGSSRVYFCCHKMLYFQDVKQVKVLQFKRSSGNGFYKDSNSDDLLLYNQIVLY
ncbi:hypothetical protein EmuJ_000395800 [Echinococcus multilocularis]|uniref:Uncharacterized protein n=1 Tax=Echinococcus multilocularis TaxID=6211 RepID=A0A068Y128_ECHMU|nr:hypothetical protein EmuJ_000395800 [Echinococcus multilocularis]